MAVITRYVNTASTAGGDGTTNGTAGATRAYATMQECETNEAADFVTDTDNLVIEASGATADTSYTFDGSTTSALYDIVINTDAVGGVYSTSYHHVEDTTVGAGDSIVAILDPYVTLNNPQIQATNSGGYSGTRAVHINVAGTVILNNPIIKGVISGAGSHTRGIEARAGTTDVQINNPLVYDFVNGTETCFGILSISSTAGSTVVYNGDFINNRTGLEVGVANAILAVNTLTQSCNNGFNGTFHSSSDYNLSDLAGDAPGGNSVNSSTLTFEDAANDDYHLVSGDTDAIGAGVGPSTDSNVPITDVDGDTRSGTTTDIGFDLYIAVGEVTPLSAFTPNTQISVRSH